MAAASLDSRAELPAASSSSQQPPHASPGFQHQYQHVFVVEAPLGEACDGDDGSLSSDNNFVTALTSNILRAASAVSGSFARHASGLDTSGSRHTGELDLPAQAPGSGRSSRAGVPLAHTAVGAAGSRESASRSTAEAQQQAGPLQQLRLVAALDVISPGDVRIVRRLAGGAFGEVFLARWHGSEVAVKCLSPQLLAPGSGTLPHDAAAELLREADRMASLRHPNIVTVFGVVLADDDAAPSSGSGCPTPAVVTEFMPAGSLRSAIDRRADFLRGGMAKLKLLLDTANGLSYLHSKQVTHFDLKAANLLVCTKDRAPNLKITDFGLSKARSEAHVSGLDALHGTLPWIAPEILLHPEQGVTQACDVYSFGVVMWEVWSGLEPFAGVPLHALLHQLTSAGAFTLPMPGTPDWDNAADGEPPEEPAPGWSDLMHRCWSKPASQRPTARQLVVVLEGMMERLRNVRRSHSRTDSGCGALSPSASSGLSPSASSGLSASASSTLSAGASSTLSAPSSEAVA